jgi:hypothetical protein
MSKMMLLRDAARENPFKTKYHMVRLCQGSTFSHRGGGWRVAGGGWRVAGQW